MTDGNYHEVCEAFACCHYFLSNLALPAAHQLWRSFNKQTNDAARPIASHKDLHEFISAKYIFISAIGDFSYIVTLTLIFHHLNSYEIYENSCEI